jgi:hypothetical protein
MSVDSINIDKNTNIKDKDSDKKFFMILSQTILAFTINIILGSYIVYVSKILHVIQLPTRMDQFPYTTTDVPDSITNRTLADNIVGINYLYTEPPSIPKPEEISDALKDVATAGIATTTATAGIATTTATAGIATATNIEKSFLISRQLFYTRIYVDPQNYKRIYNPSHFFSSLYDSKRVSILMFKLIMQQLYSFIYWGLCIFFGFVYGDTTEKQSGKSLYLWETAMMIFGPVLFLLFSVGWSFCLFYYSCYCIFMQIFTILNYESDEHGVRRDNPEMENKGPNNPKKNSWWWRGIPLFSVSGILSIWGILILLTILLGYCIFGYLLIPIFILFIKWVFSCILNTDADIYTNKESLQEGPLHFDSWKKFMTKFLTFGFITFLISILNILSFTSATTGNIIIASLFVGIYIIYNLAKTNKEKYSTSSLLLSKLEPITYVFTYIFINCSAVYGYNVMTGVIVLFIALWGLSNKHKMLFYPAKFKLNNYVPVPTKDFNLYQSDDNPRSNCYNEPTPDNPYQDVDELLKNLKGEEFVKEVLAEAAKPTK